jgi:hypothetical protein
MPAVSRKQRKVMAIAEHHPEDLYERNAGLKKMGKSKLHDYASTPEKGLPMWAPRAKRRRRRRVLGAKAAH